MKTKKNHFKLYAITAVVCCVIIGGSLVIVQNNKQESIERQKRMEIEQENKIIWQKKYEDDKNKKLMNLCLDQADEAYWGYMKLNGTEREDGTVWAQNSVWDKAQKDKEAAQNVCFKKYK